LEFLGISFLCNEDWVTTVLQQQPDILLLPAASLARLPEGSIIGLTLYVQFCAPGDGRKNSSETCSAS